ncbi:hypothetical protein ACLZH4_01580 [Methanobacterium sp. MZD130B]
MLANPEIWGPETNQQPTTLPEARDKSATHNLSGSPDGFISTTSSFLRGTVQPKCPPL